MWSLYPAEHKGAVKILDKNGNVLATTLISGTGLAPQLTLQPDPRPTIGDGFFDPDGVAVGGFGKQVC